MNHLGIYCTNAIDKKKLIDLIHGNEAFKSFFNLNNLSGALYSTIAIDALIEEEFKYDKSVIGLPFNTTLESMSSGQQKQALAKYIFQNKPDYVILDDIQSNIDVKTLSSLYALFESNATTSFFIQIFSRIEDVLPYVNEVIEVNSFFEISEKISKKAKKKS